MRFNGTTNVIANVNAALLRGVSGATVVAVARRGTNLATEVSLFGIMMVAANTRLNIGWRAAVFGNEGPYVGGRRVAANAYQGVGVSAFSLPFVIISVVINYSTATLTLYENGAQTATRVFQESGVTEDAGGAMYIGSNAAGNGAFFNGDLAELAIIPFAASQTLRQRAEGYVAHEWALNGGLVAGHPYRAFPPYV